LGDLYRRSLAKKIKMPYLTKKDGYFKETEIRDAEFTDVKDEDE
jgi:hypothetical protein